MLRPAIWNKTEEGLLAFLSYFTTVRPSIATETFQARYAWGIILTFTPMALAVKFLYPDPEADPEIAL